MNRLTVLALLALLYAIDVCAQEKLVVIASPEGMYLEISRADRQLLPRQFVARAHESNRYSLTEIQPLDDPGAVTREWKDWLEVNPGPRCEDRNCALLRVALTRRLPSGQTFVLKLSQFTDRADDVTARFAVPEPPSPPPLTPPPVAEILPSDDALHQSSRLQLRSDSDIDVANAINCEARFLSC